MSVNTKSPDENRGTSPTHSGFRPTTGGGGEGGVPPRLYEEYAYVLDFLQFGRPGTDKPRHLALPTVQVIGETYFTLLEAEIRVGTQANIHERVYIGKERREKINRIIGRISYNDLTANAKAELLPVLEDLIANQEQRFVSFFNDSQAITPRMHALELLPGIGKKSMWQIINAREKKPFTSFKDVQERTNVNESWTNWAGKKSTGFSRERFRYDV